MAPDDEADRRVALLVAARCKDHECVSPRCTHRNHPRDVNHIADHLMMLGLKDCTSPVAPRENEGMDDQ